MTRTRTIWWVAAALLAGAALAASSGGRRSIPESTKRIVWKDPDAPRRIRAYAERVEQIADWPGLSTYLVAVAYIESRGNSSAGGDDGNVARGWFGIRPVSSRAADLGLNPALALKDEAQSVALAAWYAHRMRAEANPGQRMDWLAVRRGWGRPKDVRDTDNPGYWQNLAMGLKAAGVPANFMLEPAFSSSYRWPGIEAVLQAVEGGRVA